MAPALSHGAGTSCWRLHFAPLMNGKWKADDRFRKDKQETLTITCCNAYFGLAPSRCSIRECPCRPCDPAARTESRAAALTAMYININRTDSYVAVGISARKGLGFLA